MNDIILDELQFINNELKTINWFEHCGEKNICTGSFLNAKWSKNAQEKIIESFEFQIEIITPKKALELFKSTKWVNIQLDVNASLTEYLCLNHSDLFNSKYNLVVNKIKEELIKPLDEKLIEKCKVLFSDDFQELLNTINWDITSVFIFEYFKKIYTNSFYYDLLKVYKSGHIPCGWKGKFPEGKMLIY